MKLLNRFRTSTKDAPAQTGPHLAFDRHSMIIDGKRVVVRSSAFQYFRLPSPELWRERLLTIKRAGYNAVDIYFLWSYHSPANGVYDFTGIRDVDRLLALCAEVGLYVIARPGPYICAETDGGGHPTWVINDPHVHLRCLAGRTYVDSPTYRDYARQWYEQIVPHIVRCPTLILFQIENEYINDTMNPGYMRFLADLARELGVKVPLIHNDLWKKGCWADIVDIYGVDDYAVASFGEDWRGKEKLLAGLDGLAEVRKRYCTASPLAVFELQGGWFDPWTGIGYDEMRKRLGRENVNLVTWSALAQGASIYSHYMFVGGTNWDHVGAPCVHTSYDFAAPIYEWGGVSDRYQAAKAIAHLIGAFEELFALAEPCNDVQTSDPSLVYAVRGHGDARIVFLRNLTGDVRSTTLRIGDAQTAPVSVPAWDMRVALLNVPFGQAHVTASNSVFTVMHYENQHLLVCYGAGAVTWKLPAPCRLLYSDTQAQVDGMHVTAAYDGEGWKDVVFTSGGHRYRAFFAPSADDLWVNGDYLLVGPSYTGDGQKKGGITDLPRYAMHVRGTGPTEKRIRIYSVKGMNRPEINGEMVQASLDGMCGYLRFDLPRPPRVILPTLGPWRVASAMEPEEAHPATGWRVLPQDHSLEMDKLGIYKGFAWYRAVYTGKMKEIGLAIRHNAAVYLNGRFVTKLDNYQSEATDGRPEGEKVEPVLVRTFAYWSRVVECGYDYQTAVRRVSC